MQQINMNFCVKLEKSFTQSFELLHTPHGNEASYVQMVETFQGWLNFKELKRPKKQLKNLKKRVTKTKTWQKENWRVHIQNERAQKTLPMKQGCTEVKKFLIIIVYINSILLTLNPISQKLCFLVYRYTFLKKRYKIFA